MGDGEELMSRTPVIEMPETRARETHGTQRAGPALTAHRRPGSYKSAASMAKRTVTTNSAKHVAAAFVMLVGVLTATPASAETEDTTPFDGDAWITGLVDLRPSDIDNTHVVQTGFAASGLSVTIPVGAFRGLGPYHRLPDGVEQAWYRYHIKLVDFQAASSGKLPGLSGLYSTTARGCKPSRHGARGWSGRGLFGVEGSNGAPAGEIPIGFYTYHLDQPDSCGEPMYWNNASLRPGEWHCVEGYVRLNTPGRHDGAVRGWLDGVEKFSRDGMTFRRASESGVSVREMWLDIYYGGRRPTWTQLDLMIDEMSVSTSGRVGCRDGTSGVVGSFESYADAIVEYNPATGALVLNRPLGERFEVASLSTFSPASDWSTHVV